jgi:glutathione peroxidase
MEMQTMQCIKRMGTGSLLVAMIFILLPYCSTYGARRGRSTSNINAYSFNFMSIDGKPIDLIDFKGKVLLVVNTASECRFTPQYKELEELYQQYKDQGLVVLGVPSNDFGHQEPGNEQEIACFLEEHYPITFPITEKEVVKGKYAHPFYAWVGKKAGKPQWNFYKYLIGKNGEFIKSFSQFRSPLSHKVVRAIEKALNA